MYEVFCSLCNSPHLDGALPAEGLAKTLTAGKEVWIPEQGENVGLWQKASGMYCVSP